MTKLRPEAVTRLLDSRHHLERFAMEQAGEVDYLITWRDNEFVGRVSLTPCRRAGANRRCFAFPKWPSCLRLCLHLPARETRSSAGSAARNPPVASVVSRC